MAQLEEVAEIAGGIQKQQKRRPVDNVYPFLRVANVGRGWLDLEDVHLIELFDGEIDRFRLQVGDLLVVEGNGSPSQIGRAAMWRGGIDDAVHQNHLIRVRPGPAVDPNFLELAWNSPFVSSQLREVAQTTSGLYTLSTAKVKRVRIALPSLPEQHRIVEALDDHLSRIDAAVRELKAAHRKVSAFRRAVLLSLVPERSPKSWEVTTVGEAGSIDLGRQRHPDWHHGPEMHPYLRVANVFEDRIDTTDVMEMDFTGVFERYKLEPGDVLLNEGQSPHLVGRPALYRGQPANVAFTNSLLRFRARPDVLPEWALMVFRRHLHARRFMREVRITTNIAHLSSKRLKAVEFPIPPLEEQKRLVQRCEELLTDADALERGLEQGLCRAQSLRKALLSRAFTGALVPQDATDEPASALLDRIRAERASSGKPTRAIRARRPRKTAGAELKPAPAPSNVSTLHTAIQQEFEL
ncbi:restriction endonuclease subunit S [Streptomyces sp. LX-29]|nr:restriction endonuclease subunit S [Streptomyces sp. LX-29]